jgi:CRP-like cAMP-binding protein
MKTVDEQSLVATWEPDYLKSGSTFGALSSEAIGFLLCQGRLLALSDGEELFHSGDDGGSFFIVLQGQLDYLQQRGGEGLLIRSVAFGEQLGYVAMIGLFARIGIGRAQGPTVVLEVSSDLLFQLHLDFPFDFGLLVINLSRDMARTIRKLSCNLADVCIGHAIA